MAKRILVIDNKPDDVTSVKGLLEIEGYDVRGLVVRGSLEPAMELLNSEWFHLAIIDLRLLDESGPDGSGLSLVKDGDRAITKIILTAYPEWKIGREALKLDPDGAALVANFVSKDEPEELVRAVNEAFEQHVGINFDLDIEFGGTTFIGMASLIRDCPEGDPELLAWAPELGDLFRKLFADCREISLFPMYRGHKDTVIVRVIRSKDGGELTPVIVKCGRRDVIRGEATNYDEYVQNFTGPWSTRKDNYQETLRFAGLVYAITAASLERIVRFTDFYRNADAGSASLAIEQLFQETCKAWYNHGVQQSEEGLDVSYLKQLSLREEEKKKALNEWVTAISQNANSLGLKRIERNRNEIIFQLSPEVSLRYPDPTSYIYRGRKFFPGETQWGITHGDLNGNNILVDRDRLVCWLIDFERTGWGPVLRDFAELEAVLRWELVDCKKVEMLYEFEKALVSPGSFADDIALPERKVPEDLQKAGRVLARLRELAGPIVGADIREYYMGLLFYAMRMVVSGGVTSPGQSRPSLLRRAHALLSGAMICYRLEHWDKWQCWPDELADIHTG